MSDTEFTRNVSDDEETVNPKAHRRLLAGVSSLQANQLIKKATRNEPALKRDEFHLAKPINIDDGMPARAKSKVKVNVSDLIGVLDKTNKHLQLGKTLKKTISKKKILPKPLEKPAADRLQRAINFEKAKVKLDRWDAIVAKNRSADHLSFPLNQDPSGIDIKNSVRLPSQYRIKSELMMQMEKIQPEIFQIETPTENAEKDVEPQLSREEMIQRSRELRALRMKESQKSIKAHHQNKIKSKKFHRILKKEKMRQQIKEFELLQKTDPEAALRKIEQLDRSRIEERANLRHRNTGTWAKNLQVRAKYDKEARKDLADQIAISREITAKKTIDESDNDDDDDGISGKDNENNEAFKSDPFNPWIISASDTKVSRPNEVDDFVSDYRKYWQERNQNEKKLKEYQKGSDEDEPEFQVGKENLPNEIASQANETSKLKKKKKKNEKPKPAKVAIKKTKSEKKVTKVMQKKTKVNRGWMEEDISSNEQVEVADNLDDLFDEAEMMHKSKLQKKFKQMSNEYLKPSKKKSSKPIDSDDEKDKEHPQFDLSFKKQRQRVQLDEELNGDDTSNETKLLNQQTNKSDSLKSKKQSNSNGNENVQDDSENIDPTDIAKVKPQYLNTALPDTIYGNEDDGFNEYDDAEYIFDDEKKLTIAEAFEDDDIVAEFKCEKDAEAKKNGPQEIDLSIPGWGSWGGAGIDPSKQKTKRKMILKFPAPEKRRIDNQGNVVIIENRDETLRKHLVSNLPFPFTSVDDYEQSIRLPIGKDFIPETAHRLLIKPAVRTKSGTIIEPMNENMLVKPAKKPVTKTDRRIAKMVDSD